MSEADTIIKRFRDLMYSEQSQSGRKASICVIGYFDYDSFYGALSTIFKENYSLSDDDVIEKKGLVFADIKLYKSYSVKEGFYFGGEPV